MISDKDFLRAYLVYKPSRYRPDTLLGYALDEDGLVTLYSLLGTPLLRSTPLGFIQAMQRRRLIVDPPITDEFSDDDNQAYQRLLDLIGL